jgi:hypothetical protein
VSKEEIIEKMLSDVTNKRSERKSMRDSRRSKSPVLRQQGGTSAQKFSNTLAKNIPEIGIARKEKEKERESLSNKENSKIPIPGKFDGVFDYMCANDPKKPLAIESSSPTNIAVEELLSNPDFLKSQSKQFQTFLKEKPSLPIPIDYTKCIMRMETGTRNIYMYNDVTSELNTISVEFSPYLNLKEFLPSCAWVNLRGKLYISGGEEQMEKGSRSFLVYDPATKILKRLPDMLSQRYSHSMIVHNGFIFAVGGSSNSTTEKFDLDAMKWIKLANLTLDERQNPVLYVFKDQLFAFFGYKVGAYMDSVEKLKLSNVKAKWEVVPFKNPNKLNLKLIGCGTVPVPECTDKIYFFGGRGNNDVKGKAFIFEFTTCSFLPTDIMLDDNSFFCESALFNLQDSSWGAFDTDKGSHFLKLDLS